MRFFLQFDMREHHSKKQEIYETQIKGVWCSQIKKKKTLMWFFSQLKEKKKASPYL